MMEDEVRRFKNKKEEVLVIVCQLVMGLPDDAGDNSGEDDNTAEGSQSIDEMIVNAADDTKEFDFFYSPDTFDPKKSLIKVEYDMVFTVEEYESMNSNSSDTSKEKRTAAIINGAQNGYRWTNNHIPYQFAPGTFTSYDMNTIKQALNEWSRYTCLTFAPATSGNRIYFQNGGGCSSHVGMKGGGQSVTLAKGCRYTGVVTHEVGHAIGLRHEQTRPDRDNYVKILFENIPDRLEYNFQRYSWNDIQDLHIPYDYGSIMHYGSRAFSMNNGLTIQTIDPKYQNVIGNRRRLSFRDIKTVNLMYKCARVNRCTLKDSDCPGEGFVGTDCRCWCPGDPYVLCQRNTVVKTTTTTTTRKPEDKKTGCQDQYTKCSYWAKNNQCTKSYSHMSIYCKKSCNLCQPKPVVKVCKDYHDKCPTWASQYKFCNSSNYKKYMTTNCPKSCGICTTTNNGGDKKTGVCIDESKFCEGWAKAGHCDINPSYMLRHCKKSCNSYVKIC